MNSRNQAGESSGENAESKKEHDFDEHLNKIFKPEFIFIFVKPKNPIISVAQIKHLHSSRKNVNRMKYYIKKAKKLHSDIICFHESCFHSTKNFKLSHRYIEEIREECKKNSIWCIFSEDIEIKKKVYNVALLIDRAGKIRGFYKKIHLSGDYTLAGKKIRVFKTDFARIGIVICWDLAFPEMFKRMKKSGAEIVFCPAQWWYERGAHDKDREKRELSILKSLVKARAFENLFFVALCNPLIDSKQQISYSAISSPHRILKEIFGKEGLITAKIDLSEITRSEKIYK